MKLAEISCNDRQRHFSLFPSQRGESYVVTLEPYIGRIELDLELGDSEQISAIAFSDSSTDTHSSHICRSLAELPGKLSFLLHRSEGQYHALLCLSHSDQSCWIQRKGNSLRLIGESGRSRASNQRREALVCCSAPSAWEAIHSAFKEGLRLTGGMGRLIEEKPPLPPWLGHLGWENPSPEPSHEQTMACLRGLRDAGIPIHYVLINHGWQQCISHRKLPAGETALLSFQADLQRFPKGLKGLVEEIRAFGIEHVGLCHQITGAKGGIHPRLAEQYQLPIDPLGRFCLGQELGHSFEFFHDYYSFLREQGISFVRVADDALEEQYCPQKMSRSELYRNLQISMQAAASLHFNNAHFDSSGLQNHKLFCWSTSRIASTSHPNLVFPERLEEQLCQSLWLQHLMSVDLGPWQSTGAFAETEAIFHALSGTFCSINDACGEHDRELLRALMLPSGKLLQADKPLSLCIDQLLQSTEKSKSLCIAQTQRGSSHLLGLFNLQRNAITEHISLASLDLLKAEENYTVYSFRQGFLGIHNRESSILTELAPLEADVLTISPLNRGVSVLGCPDFFLMSGPIQSVHHNPDSVHIRSRISAPLLVYSEREILEVRSKNRVVPWEYDPQRQTLLIDPRATVEERKTHYSVFFES